VVVPAADPEHDEHAQVPQRERVDAGSRRTSGSRRAGFFDDGFVRVFSRPRDFSARRSVSARYRRRVVFAHLLPPHAREDAVRADEQVERAARRAVLEGQEHAPASAAIF
jgi:hypothetical protein